MSKEIHRKSYEAAIEELSELAEKREELENLLDAVDSELARIKWAVKGIANLCDAHPEKEYPHLFPEDVSPDVGFTDAIREILNADAGFTYHSPVSVRNVLEKNGFDLKKYKNPLASIHTILKRLVKQGQAKSRVIDGKVGYTGI
jgi:DNA-binding PadR family transcriptional regulator